MIPLLRENTISELLLKKPLQNYNDQGNTLFNIISLLEKNSYVLHD